LDEKHTRGDRHLIERIIAEDYFIDTIHYFEGNRIECAKRLAKSMPIQYPYEPLLCEVLFSQMMRLPEAEFKPIMYGTLMVDLCKLQEVFPRAMSACVRELFSRIHVLDPRLAQRLAEWLAYHTSNYEFVWPWQKWAHVLEAPASDAQKRFCVEVIERMVRLSYWESVHDFIPENFRVLLPPKPDIEGLPSIEDTDASMKDLEGLWASRCIEIIRKKSTASELDAWLKSNELEAVLGGVVPLTRMLLRSLMFAGRKSYSHMIIALERYYGPLANLMQVGGDEARMEALQTVTRVWSKNIHRAVMAIDRLMTLRLVSATHIIQWSFKSGYIANIEDQMKCSLAWESLYRAVDKACARVEDTLEDIEKLKQKSDPESQSLLQTKNEDLKNSEMQKDEAIIMVIQQLIVLLESETLGIPGLIESENLTDFIAADENSSKETILISFLVQNLQSFLRKYFTSTAEQSTQINKLASDSKLPIIKLVTHSMFDL